MLDHRLQKRNCVTGTPPSTSYKSAYEQGRQAHSARLSSRRGWSRSPNAQPFEASPERRLRGDLLHARGRRMRVLEQAEVRQHGRPGDRPSITCLPKGPKDLPAHIAVPRPRAGRVRLSTRPVAALLARAGFRLVARRNRLRLARVSRRRGIKTPRQKDPQDRGCGPESGCGPERAGRHVFASGDAGNAIHRIRERRAFKPASDWRSAVQRDHGSKPERDVSYAQHAGEQWREPFWSPPTAHDAGSQTRDDDRHRTEGDTAARRRYRQFRIVHCRDRIPLWPCSINELNPGLARRHGRHPRSSWWAPRPTDLSGFRRSDPGTRKR